MADLAERGVTKPVLPGIMPVTSLKSVPRMAAMGAAVPAWMVERLEAADARGGAEAVRREGVACATELCEELLEAGCPGLHFYTLNRSSATREIYSALGLATPGPGPPVGAPAQPDPNPERRPGRRSMRASGVATSSTRP